LEPHLMVVVLVREYPDLPVPARTLKEPLAAYGWTTNISRPSTRPAERFMRRTAHSAPGRWPSSAGGGGFSG